jgi:hypothetical protein
MSIDAKQDVGVLVAGAGPTDLTLACELLRRGVSRRIIGKAPAPATTSRALGLQPGTLELFDRMDIIDGVISTGGPVIDGCFSVGWPTWRRATPTSRRRHAGQRNCYLTKFRPPYRRRGRSPRGARLERLRLAGRVRYAAQALWRSRGSTLPRPPRWLRRPPRTAGRGRPAARIPRTAVPAGASLIGRTGAVVRFVRGPDYPSHRGPERWRSRRRRGTIDAKGARE